MASNDHPINSNEFVVAVNSKVKDIMEKGGNLEKYNGKISHESFDFKKILGESDDYYWWRLYINPKDWADALKCGDPRLLYNNDNYGKGQQQKGFHGGMVRAYAKYLANEYNQRIELEQYLAIHEATKPEKLEGDPKEVSTFRNDVNVSFDSPERFGDGVLRLEFDITPKGAKGPMKKYYLIQRVTDEMAFTKWANVGLDNECLQTMATGDALKAGITETLKRLYQELGEAQKQSDQLRAIAKAVLCLHIMHPFTDGCGRTNVFTLLPLLLLRCGFGLPLGGKYIDELDKDVLYLLFNGGYSVEQIAQFLFVSQDSGIREMVGNKLKYTGCLGVEGNPPPQPFGK